MSVYQRDNKFYYKGKFTLPDGRSVYYNRLAKGCTCLEDARILEKNFIMKKELERYEVRTGSTVTFGKLCEIYFDDRRNVRKSTTIQNDKFGLTKFVRLRPVCLCDIKPATIQVILDEMDKNGASASYVNKIRSLAHKIFAYAVREDLLESNPVDKVAKLVRPDELQEEIRFWTYDEFSAFIENVDQNKHNRYYCLYNFQYFMGCRKGESLALNWNDINFDNNTVKINKTIAQQLKGIPYKLTPPKTKNSIRTIKMPDKLVKIMRDRYARVSKEENFSRTNFVFGDEQPLGIKYIGVLFKQYAEFAGVPVIRIHDLRHSHASFLINKGANIKAIASRLGDNVETVLGVYTHLFFETEDELVKIINDNCY